MQSVLGTTSFIIIVAISTSTSNSSILLTSRLRDCCWKAPTMIITLTRLPFSLFVYEPFGRIKTLMFLRIRPLSPLSKLPILRLLNSIILRPTLSKKLVELLWLRGPHLLEISTNLTLMVLAWKIRERVILVLLLETLMEIGCLLFLKASCKLSIILWSSWHSDKTWSLL